MNKRTIRTGVATTALTIGTFAGAFLLPAMPVYASDGMGAIYVEIPQGWQNHERTLQIKTEDYVITGSSGKEITVIPKKVEVAFDDGEYADVTDSMVVTINHNGILKLRVMYTDGNFVSNEIKIDNFDLEEPTIKASVEGEIMYLEATDEISGVADINVNGKAFTELSDGQMCANIKDLEATDEYITIHSDDIAGNSSKEFKIKNPYYVGEIESGQEDKSLDNPDSVEATDPTKARGSVKDDFVTQDREFLTVDASGKTFYLIVDRTQNQENVYLLTEAGVNDLLNFTDYNGVDVENGDIPMYVIPSTGAMSAIETDETVPEEPKADPEPDKKKGNGLSSLAIILIAALGGVGLYLFKKKKRKDELDEAEEMDVYDVPDGTEISEGEIEYEEGDEPDEEYEDEEAEDEDDEQLIQDEDYFAEGSDEDAEKARLMAYFVKNDTEETEE